ncbi:hypothetical protein Ppb6_02189 [Photorhabdus australis subsp. thailandensis]|uniref:Uncharacterized protein n=1 Tax=Photorhabdus australis subsp. thailandensis TaxID=2805096 RepID=A0A1C0U3U6_9GAMM|nr:hypothetical protein Ppb6_02189 [Photorhabdus australis subsp. thailandensis]
MLFSIRSSLISIYSRMGLFSFCLERNFSWNIMLKTESLKHPGAVYVYSHEMQGLANIYYGHVIRLN